MTLAEFLLARIAEDEAVARAATLGPWATSPSKYVAGHYVHGDRSNGEQVAHATETTKANASHIARHDPARVFAECEAKRRIVALHRPERYADVDEHFCTTCRAGAFERTVDWPCPTLRALALPYADHPDYQEEWRP